MKKTLLLLTLLMMLLPATQVFAEEAPGDEPEIFDSAVQILALDTDTVTLDEEPAPEPEPDQPE